MDSFTAVMWEVEEGKKSAVIPVLENIIVDEAKAYGEEDRSHQEGHGSDRDNVDQTSEIKTLHCHATLETGGKLVQGSTSCVREGNL